MEVLYTYDYALACIGNIVARTLEENKNELSTENNDTLVEIGKIVIEAIKRRENEIC